MEQIELYVPDRAASENDETFFQGDEKVSPEIIKLSGFGAMVKLGSKIYQADRDEMWGYPNPGIYHLNAE